MSLRTKTMLIIGAILTALILVLYVVLSQALQVRFGDLETMDVRQDVGRGKGALLMEYSDLDRKVSDWAPRDDTYNFTQDQNQSYIGANLTPWAFRSLSIDLMLFYDPHGKLIFTRGYDHNGNLIEQAPQPLLQALAAHPELFSMTPPDHTQSGLVAASTTQAMISLHPILDSSRQKPPRGTLVFVRNLDGVEMQHISSLSNLDLVLEGIPSPGSAASLQPVINQLKQGQDVVVKPESGQIVRGYSLVPDIFGKPAMLLEITSPRTTNAQAQTALNYLMAALGVVGLFFILITIFLVDRLILARMISLSRGVTKIGKMGNLAARLPDGGQDEVGRLGEAINNMLNELQHAQKLQAENEERYRSAVFQAKEGFALIDAENGAILDANAAFYQLSGVSQTDNRSICLSDWLGAAPAAEASADDNISAEARPLVRTLALKQPDETQIDLEISVDRIEYQDRPVDYVIVRNITERKKLEEERQHLLQESLEKVLENERLFSESLVVLEQRQEAENQLAKRERYLAALVELQRILLASSNSQIDLAGLLEILGKTAGASRVHAFINSFPSGHKLVLGHRAEWDAEGTQSQIHNPAWLELSYQNLPHLLEGLERGETFSGAVNELADPEKGLFEMVGVTSLLAIPLQVNGAFYGIISFDRCGELQQWDESEITQLRIAASALSMAYERKQAEEVSRQRASELQAVFNAFPDLFIRMDAEGKIIDYHSAALATVPAGEQPVFGKRIQEVFPPIAAQQIYAGMLDVQRKGGVVSLEYQVPSSQGTQVFDARLSPFPGGQTIALVRDITARKQTEQAMRKNEVSIRSLYNITSSQQLSFSEKLQALLVMGCQHFGMDAGMLAHISGEHFEVVETFAPNNQFTRTSTYLTSEMFCRNTLDAGGPLAIADTGASPEWANHPSRVRWNVEAYLGSPVVVSGSVFGTLNFTSRSPRPQGFTSADKEFLRLMAQWVGSEIEQEQSTQQLQKYAAEISKKNQALAEARDEAVTAGKQKSEFLATMSHEIRTPMNAIIGMTDLLLETSLAGDQREYTSIVRDSAQILLSLLNDILDFSKIDAGKLKLERIEFSPLKVVERAADLFVPRIREKGLEMMTFIAPEIPAILKGDPTRLTQVLFNLIGNAVKFTEKGEIVVRAVLEKQTAQSCLVRFSVEDTGIGLSEGARARLFQPFSQAEGSTTRKYGGTGLGLAISKSIAELMDGEIGVESREGCGSTFWFTGVFEPIEPGEPAGKAVLTGLEPHGRVLVVDASRAHQDILVRYLASQSIPVKTASSGEMALQMLKQACLNGSHDPFRVALIDLALPDMDAYTLARSLFAIPGLQSTRLVLVTSLDERSQGEQALDYGFSGYLMKPIRQEQLFALVGALLGSEADEAVLLAKNGAHQAEKTTTAALIQAISKEQAASISPVLLAEDNLANQKLAMVQLQKLGYRVVTVSNGREVLETVLKTNQKFSLILMDCQMPEVDGFAVTGILRKAELTTGHHLPIVAMTANALQGDREVCLASGMDDYISKPVSLKDLSQVLDRWILKSVNPTEALEREGLPGGDSPQGGQSEPSPLNPEVIQGIRALQGDGEDFLTVIVDMYLHESIEIVEKMRQALQNGQADELRRETHTLKGSSSNLGAVRLVERCQKLEILAREGKLEDAPDVFREVEQEYGRVVQALLLERQPQAAAD